MPLNNLLTEKMKRFQNKWASIEAGRQRLSPSASAEEKAEANDTQRENVEESVSELHQSFSKEELDAISHYVHGELQPIINPAVPKPLNGNLPVREVDGELMETYYFWREYV